MERIIGVITIKKSKIAGCMIGVLVLIDQLLKLIILHHGMRQEFDILAGIVSYHPIQNMNQSYAGNYISLFSNRGVMIIFNILAIILLISGYHFYQHKKQRTSTSVKLIMIFGLAGCICSLIDKMFWGGSLDYINLMNFFTFDLKDCYLTLAEIVFVVLALIHSKEISIKEYISYYMQKIKRNKNR